MGHDPFAATPHVLPPEPLEGRAPRLLAHVHMYPPGHNAGAEWMLADVLQYLRLEAGWEVEVWASQVRRDYDFEGIRVRRADDDLALAGPYGWCDVALTHLDCTGRAIAWARRGRRPLIHLVHNHRQLAHHRVDPRDAALVVWNSRWVADQHASWPGQSLIVRPPLTDRARVEERGDRVTLLNLTAAKGAGTFWELAALLPETRFLGVLGSYGGQEIPKPLPRNVEVLDNTPDVADAYRRTRVLLAPSHYESWGRVAAEAMLNGIPVIASSTAPGLIECTTTEHRRRAALYADPEQVGQWVAHLRTLDQPGPYAYWSLAGRARGEELRRETGLDLHALDLALRRLAARSSALPTPAP